jgi:3-methyladenine DNA glycosylase Mpg
MADNGMDLVAGTDIELFADPAYRPRIIRTKRVGVDYSGRWKDRLLRFIDTTSPTASKLKWQTATRREK